MTDTTQNTQEGLQLATTFGADQATAFTWGGYFQALGVLLLLLALLWGLLWLLRKYGKFRFMPTGNTFPRAGLQLETQLPLGPRKGLMVVRYLDERLLLGVTEHNITLLRTLPLDAQNADERPSKKTSTLEADSHAFAQILATEQETDKQ